MHVDLLYHTPCIRPRTFSPLASSEDAFTQFRILNFIYTGCKSSYYGVKCSNKCECLPNGKCHHSSGTCKCKRKYFGAQCSHSKHLLTPLLSEFQHYVRPKVSTKRAYHRIKLNSLTTVSKQL